MFGSHQHMDGNEVMGGDGDHLGKMCINGREGQRKRALRSHINDNGLRKSYLDGD